MAIQRISRSTSSTCRILCTVTRNSKMKAKTRIRVSRVAAGVSDRVDQTPSVPPASEGGAQSGRNWYRRGEIKLTNAGGNAASCRPISGRAAKRTGSSGERIHAPGPKSIAAGTSRPRPRSASATRTSWPRAMRPPRIKGTATSAAAKPASTDRSSAASIWRPSECPSACCPGGLPRCPRLDSLT